VTEAVRDGKPSKSGRTRRLVRVVVVLAVLVVAGATAGFVLMLPARKPLAAGQTAIERGRSFLLRGNLAGAHGAFRHARDRFDEGLDRLSNPLTALAGLLPVVGRTPDAVVAIARAGSLAAEGAVTLLVGMEAAPGGPAALTPRNGAIDVDALARLEPSVGRARALVVEAHRSATDVTTSLVPDLVAGPLAEARTRLAEARRGLAAAHTLLEALPSFLGADGEKRYFFGAQNPAELRGTGGLIGAYSILSIDRGRIRLGPFAPAGRLGLAGSRIEPPNPDYGALYGRYGALSDMSNINMTPDFPSAATAIERLYEHATGERLDGTVVADPEALALLMEASGPVDEPVTGTRLDSSNVVRFVSNEAYALLPDSDARKRILGDVAGRVLAEYLSGRSGADPIRGARALIAAGSEGHLLLHAVELETQAALDTAGLSGRLLSPEGDFLAVVVNNASGGKMDYYAERSIRYGVTLRPDGSARARAEVEFRNNAPTQGQPAYVIGPHPFLDTRPGDSVMIVQTYCAAACSMERTAIDGRPQEPVILEELGHPLSFAALRVPSKDIGRVGYGWTLPDAWANGLYRFTFQGQPTIRPTDLEVGVLVPPGVTVVDAAPGVEVNGRRASWRGTAPDKLHLWLRVG
jgi:hypothetical protein